jgi:hypothetical protein
VAMAVLAESNTDSSFPCEGNSLFIFYVNCKHIFKEQLTQFLEVGDPALLYFSLCPLDL